MATGDTCTLRSKVVSGVIVFRVSHHMLVRGRPTHVLRAPSSDHESGASEDHGRDTDKTETPSRANCLAPPEWRDDLDNSCQATRGRYI